MLKPGWSSRALGGGGGEGPVIGIAGNDLFTSLTMVITERTYGTFSINSAGSRYQMIIFSLQCFIQYWVPKVSKKYVRIPIRKLAKALPEVSH